ncbi:MAG: acyl-CoA thioesterase [Lentisphaeria bacterium]|nr:acyl-CoA thioesterase [Lentisphaeria bacterium]
MRRRKSYFSTPEGMPAPVTVTVRRRTAFSEVDAMAVAWHGNYLRFFEAAHAELMQKIGLGFSVYAAHGIAAPVVQSHVDYYSPLLLDEEFTVRAELFWNDGARLDTAYTIRGSDGALRATGYTVQMFCGLKDREALIFPPEPVVEMRKRWLNGELHD